MLHSRNNLTNSLDANRIALVGPKTNCDMAVPNARILTDGVLIHV